MALFIPKLNTGFSQTHGITSGDIYTLKSKSGNMLLDVRNSSIEDGAKVDIRTDTKSDAQRWFVTKIGNDAYKITNVASGRLLHITSAPSDSVKIDQFSDTGNDDVKWTIKNAGKGYFCLKPVIAPGYSLNSQPGDTTDGTSINLSVSSPSDSQKWMFRNARL